MSQIAFEEYVRHKVLKWLWNMGYSSGRWGTNTIINNFDAYDDEEKQSYFEGQKYGLECLDKSCDM